MIKRPQINGNQFIWHEQERRRRRRRKLLFPVVLGNKINTWNYSLLGLHKNLWVKGQSNHFCPNIALASYFFLCFPREKQCLITHPCMTEVEKCCQGPKSGWPKLLGPHSRNLRGEWKVINGRLWEVVMIRLKIKAMCVVLHATDDLSGGGSGCQTHLDVVCREPSLRHLEAKRSSIRTGSCINKSVFHSLEPKQQERNSSCQKQSRPTKDQSKHWSHNANLSH